MRQTFVVVNENLVFKNATILFSFAVPKDKNQYLLYYVSDMNDGSNKLLISELRESDNGKVFLFAVADERIAKIKSYIKALLEGESSKKEIRISKKEILFEENICQSIIETANDIECSNVLDIERAVNNIPDKYWETFEYVNDLNKVMYDYLVRENDYKNRQIEQENRRGNISVFLLTLFAVSFLTMLVFMGYGLFFGR